MTGKCGYERTLSDPLLDIQYQAEWSAMRSGHSGREIFAYAVISDSGKLWDVEAVENESIELTKERSERINFNP